MSTRQPPVVTNSVWYKIGNHWAQSHSLKNPSTVLTLSRAQSNVSNTIQNQASSLYCSEGETNLQWKQLMWTNTQSMSCSTARIINRILWYSMSRCSSKPHTCNWTIAFSFTIAETELWFVLIKIAWFQGESDWGQMTLGQKSGGQFIKKKFCNAISLYEASSVK